MSNGLTKSTGITGLTQYTIQNILKLLLEGRKWISITKPFKLIYFPMGQSYKTPFWSSFREFSLFSTNPTRIQHCFYANPAKSC